MTSSSPASPPAPVPPRCPILIWSKVKLGVTPDINALATIIIVVVGIGVAIAGYLMHRADKIRERDIQMAIAANK